MANIPCPNLQELQGSIHEIKTVGETKWLRLEQITYFDNKNVKRSWDRVVRTTTKSDEDIDAGTAVTVAVKNGQPGIICVTQFRPAVRKVCLEFPAGIIDLEDKENDTILRELREETGYEGEIIYASPRLVLSPGMGCESIKLALVWADPAHPKNDTPEACPDEGENIEVLFLPLEGLRQTLDELSTKGILIFDAVYTFAMGLEVANLPAQAKELGWGPAIKKLGKLNG
eukprot:Gregarina_sp_Poly_1__4373@NODE_2365_length_2227_cov_41_264352_g1507_i0_p2_GENE_NODE_2365_length_2227_cov_41_264352_g1507_i0NODE_2365_length_2227_cov_41_264352_g1507_i0_p2_ORF_typecomplete_len229_score31_70NUDIX/PF00293_28/2_2e03NUDIX/PF00293_28/7_3e10_NODE_2365_length_2227_cov_41_264352_g1507_i014682154